MKGHEDEKIEMEDTAQIAQKFEIPANVNHQGECGAERKRILSDAELNMYKVHYYFPGNT